MIKHYPFQQLGKANYKWLKANYHFSFSQYYNPYRMGFGKLRVINDDWIAPGQGFPEHPHKNMEIISFIRSGAIAHEDSKGNQGVTSAGEVQVMSAGKGIWHSEANLTKQAVTLFQIWIEPNKQNVIPRWDSTQFSQKNSETELPLLVSGFDEDKDKALFIHQKARIYAGKIKQGTEIVQPITQQAYVLASQGKFELVYKKQVVTMNTGDGAEITFKDQVLIKAITDCEIVIIDVPK